ncbi:MAG: nucleotidyltransferase family protein [Taibaiella sp.]|nr:nucleotidyltransferase family protein [Taibaiella sp.]
MTAQKTGIIILAAGSSSRMGSPKQLLTFNGATLLQHAITVAMGVGAGATLVVLGAHAEEVMPIANVSDVHVVVNNDWREGMASSIRCGLQNLLMILPEAEAVLILLCDQPYVTTKLLGECLHAAEATEKSIVACAYGNVTGVPALFKKEMFDELMLLEGDVGARRVIQRNAEHVILVPFTAGAVDIDTPDDYARLCED